MELIKLMEPQYVLAFVTFIFGVCLLHTGIKFMFAVESYSTYKKRQRQLRNHGKKDKDITPEEAIDTVTKPIIEHLFSKIKPKGIHQLEKDLRMVGWDDKVTAEQYKALIILSRAVGLVVFGLLYSMGETLFAFVLGGACFFIVSFLLKNERSELETKLMADFPDFVRIVQGYLTIDQPFVLCVENSLKFVGPAWRNILEEFIVLCNTRGVEDALGWMKEQVDIFEVKEFLSMVKLSLEQGGSAKDSFNEQANKVNEMLQDLIRIKVEQRRIMSIAVQAPLLIACFITFGLPIFGEMMSLNLM